QLPRPTMLSNDTSPPIVSTISRMVARPRPAPRWPGLGRRRHGRNARRRGGGSRAKCPTGVLHGYRYTVILLLGPYRYRPALRRVPQRIPHEVAEHQCDPLAVGHHRLQVRWHMVVCAYASNGSATIPRRAPGGG